MSERRRENPGFYAIMAASAFAEEGLAEAALDLLGGASPKDRVQPAKPARPWAGLGIGAGEARPRTA